MIKKESGHVTVYLGRYLYKQKRKRKTYLFFALINHLSQMEFSFVRIISFFSLFLLLEYDYLLRTAYVLCRYLFFCAN